MKEPYIVVDIETTGLSRDRHKITEIAAIKLKNNKIQDEFQTLINPEVKIPPFITSLTGIDDKMVKYAPKIKEVLPNFRDFIGDSPMVAHCAAFDHGFLNHNIKLHFSSELNNIPICTKKLSRRLLPQLQNYRLSTITEHFQIKNKQAHRAMTDAEVTSKVFIELSSIMKKQGIEKKDQVIEFQDSKIVKKNII